MPYTLGWTSTRHTDEGKQNSDTYCIYLCNCHTIIIIYMVAELIIYYVQYGLYGIQQLNKDLFYSPGLNNVLTLFYGLWVMKTFISTEQPIFHRIHTYL